MPKIKLRKIIIPITMIDDNCSIFENHIVQHQMVLDIKSNHIDQNKIFKLLIQIALLQNVYVKVRKGEKLI